MKEKTTPERVQEMIDLYQSGEKIAYISRKMNLTESYCYYRLTKAGMKFRKPGPTIPELTEDEKKQIKRLYLQGSYASDIAPLFDISATVCLDILKEQGITIRRYTQPTRPEIENQALVRDWNNGMSLEELAKKYKHTIGGLRTRVYRLRKAGYPVSYRTSQKKGQ